MKELLVIVVNSVRYCSPIVNLVRINENKKDTGFAPQPIKLKKKCFLTVLLPVSNQTLNKGTVALYDLSRTVQNLLKMYCV
jgi:hypothetical protein